MLWLLIVPLVVVIALAPFIFETQRRVVGKAMRDRSGGSFANLTDGVTRYRWHGPEHGSVIVAIHGLTTPCIVWDGIIPALTRQGYRVLSYDLLGRGLSDAPTKPQTLMVFRKQLAELLADQDIDGPLGLLGYSMGGSIAVDFAAHNPSRVTQVLLVAPAGIVTHETLFDRTCRVVPWFGDWLHAMFAVGRMRRGGPKPAPISDMQRFQLTRRGYLPAVLASRRKALAQTQADDHWALAKAGMPMMAIWAKNDTTIPSQAMGQLAQWNRNVVHKEITAAGHGLPYTHPQATADALVNFLNR